MKKKILITGLSLLTIIGLSSYVYLTKSAYWKISSSDRELFIANVKSAKPLPDRFYTIYDKIYPNALSKGQFSYFLDPNYQESECPCRLASYTSGYTTNIHLVPLTFWAEDHLSQKECLNFYAENFNFTHKVIGIQKASEAYYSKKLENLNDDEIIELIIIMKNPVFYNKKRQASRLEQKHTEIKERIKLEK